MLENLNTKLYGTETGDFLSPAQIAEDVNSLHESLDEAKAWSLETVEWLASEQKRLEDEGDHENAEELDDLMLYVQTVFMRIQHGDDEVLPSVEEEIEEQ